MLGQILQKALKEAGISPADAASHIGVSETNLYRLFKKDSFEVSYLKKAATLLNLPLSYFLGESAPNLVNATQTGDFNQAGTNNSQKVKVDKAQASAQDLADKLAACQRELALANALVAAKEETITLLRATYSRPN